MASKRKKKAARSTKTAKALQSRKGRATKALPRREARGRLRATKPAVTPTRRKSRPSPAPRGRGAREKAAPKKAAATRAKRRAKVEPKHKEARHAPRALKPRKTKAPESRPAPSPIPPVRFAEGPPRKVGFALGPHVLRREKQLGRRLTPAEIRRETVPSTRDLAIIEVWPDLSPSAREKMGPQLTPAGERELSKRIRSGKRTAWGLLMESVGLRPMRRARFVDLSDAERRALEAWRKGTLDQQYMSIASRSGLTPNEVYTLAMSPPSMGRAA